MLTQDKFEKLVKEALMVLPKNIRDKMDNVAIVVEKRPSSSELGLYQGVPKTSWGRGFGQILPDKITIFQESIERYASSETELRSTRDSVIKELIKNVIWHEVAHHFGFSERGVKLLEQKRG